MEYLMVVPVNFYRAPDGRIACESAFAEHLRMSRELFEPRFTSIRIAAPTMPPHVYEANKHHLGHMDEEKDRIYLTELHQDDISRFVFFLIGWIPVYWKIFKAVRGAGLVHSGLSYDILMPFEIWSLFVGFVLRRKTVFVIDIDHRKSADMNYANGRMSKKSYMLDKYVYGPLRSLQIKWASACCSLLMLKSQSLVDDYGKGRDHVKNFLDVAFSIEYLIPDDTLNAKVAALPERKTPLELTYFGRLVPYKGIDFCIRAVHEARKQGADARLHILGSGTQEEELKALTKELGEEQSVIFYGAVPFGPKFFEQLYGYHLLMAAPLHQDTPRSAFDAMASGIPLLAFDTDYYTDLVRTGAVDVVPWRSVEGLAEKIVWFDKNREALGDRMRSGVKFAVENTQQIWMDRRIDWTNNLFEKKT